MNIADLLGGNLLSGIKDIIGTFVTDPTKKLEMEQAARELAYKQAQLVEESVQKEIEAKQAIMVAELNQEDKYTKRARPTIVYVGLAGMLVNYVALPWLAYFTKGRAELPPIAIPDYFWGIWGGVCSLYVIGRTAEKTGVSLPFMKPIPGALDAPAAK